MSSSAATNRHTSAWVGAYERRRRGRVTVPGRERQAGERVGCPGLRVATLGRDHDNSAYSGRLGNFAARCNDYPKMTCDAVRVALSALLDGEPPGADPAELTAHLVACPACRDWRARAEMVTRTVRKQAGEVPDLTATVLTAVAADGGLPRGNGGRCCASRSGWSPSPRLLSRSSRSWVCPPARTSDERWPPSSWRSRSGSASRPTVRGVPRFVPMAVVLSVCLAVTSVLDIMNGSTLPVHEVGHLAAIVQAGLLWALARACDTGAAPGRVIAAGPTAGV